MSAPTKTKKAKVTPPPVQSGQHRASADGVHDIRIREVTEHNRVTLRFTRGPLFGRVRWLATATVARRYPVVVAAPSQEKEPAVQDDVPDALKSALRQMIAQGTATVARGPSPYVSVHFARTQAEELLALLQAQPQKKWKPLTRSVVRALNQNGNGRKYHVDRAGWTTDTETTEGTS